MDAELLATKTVLAQEIKSFRKQSEVGITKAGGNDYLQRAMSLLGNPERAMDLLRSPDLPDRAMSLLSNPDFYVPAALGTGGAAAGSLAGYLASDSRNKKKRLRNIIAGGAFGGATGVGLGYGARQLLKSEPDLPTDKVVAPPAYDPNPPDRSGTPPRKSTAAQTLDWWKDDPVLRSIMPAAVLGEAVGGYPLARPGAVGETIVPRMAQRNSLGTILSDIMTKDTIAPKSRNILGRAGIDSAVPDKLVSERLQQIVNTYGAGRGQSLSGKSTRNLADISDSRVTQAGARGGAAEVKHLEDQLRAIYQPDATQTLRGNRSRSQALNSLAKALGDGSPGLSHLSLRKQLANLLDSPIGGGDKGDELAKLMSKARLDEAGESIRRSSRRSGRGAGAIGAATAWGLIEAMRNSPETVQAAR